MAPPDPTLRHDRGPVLFVADLHLDRQQATTDCFRALCEGPARAAAALYILGDLFDVWIGDDDPEPAYVPVFDALAALTAIGVPAYFIAGNRDFLVGTELLERTGMRALAEPTLIDLFGTRTLLCHGDTLCTDDVDYQQFRAQVRTPQWQRDFLHKPLDERRRIADGLRGGSRDSMASKASAIMDVNEAAVIDALRTYDARQMIHGHTHRPAHHEHRVDGEPASRYVLSDWDRRASMVAATAAGLRFETIDC